MVRLERNKHEQTAIASGDISKAFLKADECPEGTEPRYIRFRMYKGGLEHVWRLNPVRLLKFSLFRPVWCHGPFPRYEIEKNAINFFGVGEHPLSQGSRSGEFFKIHSQTLSQSHFQSKALGLDF